MFPPKSVNWKLPHRNSWRKFLWSTNYGLIAADLSKQKALDADSRAIQQIIFTGKIKSTVAGTKVIIYYICELSMETILQVSKATAKVLWEVSINGWVQ